MTALLFVIGISVVLDLVITFYGFEEVRVRLDQIDDALEVIDVLCEALEESEVEPDSPTSSHVPEVVEKLPRKPADGMAMANWRKRQRDTEAGIVQEEK